MQPGVTATIPKTDLRRCQGKRQAHAHLYILNHAFSDWTGPMSRPLIVLPKPEPERAGLTEVQPIEKGPNRAKCVWACRACDDDNRMLLSSMATSLEKRWTSLQAMALPSLTSCTMKGSTPLQQCSADTCVGRVEHGRQ